MRDEHDLAVRLTPAKITGISRNTLKEHFRQLVAKRRLTLHGAGRGAWYSFK